MKVDIKRLARALQHFCNRNGIEFENFGADEGVAFAYCVLLYVREEAMNVMDSDEMYDMLPGDGQDDRIISFFEKELDKRLKKMPEHLAI